MIERKSITNGVEARRLGIINETLDKYNIQLKKLNKYSIMIKIVDNSFTVLSIGLGMVSLTCGVLSVAGIVPVIVTVSMIAGGSGVNIFELLIKKLGINKSLRGIKRKRKLFLKYYNRLYFYKAKFLNDGAISSEEYNEFLKIIKKVNKKVDELENVSESSSENENHN